MLLNEIPVIITNDLSEWRKISRNLNKILEKMSGEGYTTSINKLQVVSPKEYRGWRKATTNK